MTKRALCSSAVFALLIASLVFWRHTEPASSATCAPAGAIAFGETISCSISVNGEQDAFTFTGQSGDRVHIRAADLSATALQPEIELSGPSGAICSTNNATLAKVDCTLNGTAGAHTYTLVVSDFLNASTGAYGLHLQRTTAPANPTAIASGETIQAQLGVVPEMDAYSFQATAGTSATLIAMEGAPGPIHPEIRLYGPAGLICSANGNPAQTTCVLPGTGTLTYTILIADFPGASPGYYCVSLNVQSPQCPDLDIDTVPDGLDNCTNAANTDQANTDAPNAAAGRPGTDNRGDACDIDDDGDGYTDAEEEALPDGGNTLAYCAIMRADVHPLPMGDGAVSTLDLASVSQYFLNSVTPATEAYNQDADGVISILDLAIVSNSFLKHVRDCP